MAVDIVGYMCTCPSSCFSVQYTMAAGTQLALPLRLAAGQSPAESAVLLQLALPSVAPFYTTCPQDAPVVADITQQHLRLQIKNDAMDSIQGTSSSRTAQPTQVLGAGVAVMLLIQGLATGAYRLIVPALWLQSNSAAAAQGRRDEGVLKEIHIMVLPLISTATAAAAAAAPTPPCKDAAAEAVNTIAERKLLWAAGSSQSPPSALLLPLSLPEQLSITSCCFSMSEGLRVKVTGSGEQLSAVQVVAVFSRFLPDESVAAAVKMRMVFERPSNALLHHMSCGQLSRYVWC
jgi:hypothetical protein